MLRCTQCGSTYPDNLRAEWGKTVGIGLGPYRGECPALVDSSFQLIQEGDRDTPGQLCRGHLVAEANAPSRLKVNP